MSAQNDRFNEMSSDQVVTVAIKEKTYQEWHNQIKSCKTLSQRATMRYAAIFKRLQPFVSRVIQTAAFDYSEIDPYVSLQMFLGRHGKQNSERAASTIHFSDCTCLPSLPYQIDSVSAYLQSELPCTCGTEIKVFGDGGFFAEVNQFVSNTADFIDAVESSSPLEQTEVPIHPSRCGRLVDKNFVAIRWEADSLSVRSDAQSVMVENVLSGDAMKRLPVQFAVNQNYALFRRPSDGSVWSLSPNFGITLEDLLRSDLALIDDEVREKVVASFACLYAEMLRCGQLWGGGCTSKLFPRRRSNQADRFRKNGKCGPQPN